MSALQDMEGQTAKMSLEERALMSLYLEENPSATLDDLMYSREWHQNFIEWVKWKRGKRKAFKMKERVWIVESPDGMKATYRDRDAAIHKLYVEAMSPDQRGRAGNASLQTYMMDPGEERDFGFARVRLILKNKKGRRLKWPTVRGRAKRRT